MSQEEKVIEQTTAGSEASIAPDGQNDPSAALRNELEEAKALAANYLDQWRRTTAEFSNYRKRQERDRVEMAQSGKVDIILQVLPVLDDFDRAFKAVPIDMQSHSLLEGFRLIERKFNQTLERMGVTAVQAVGLPFDPSIHESVASELSDQDEGIVLEEFRKGYKLLDKVLRPAMVKISSGKAPTPTESATVGEENPV